MFNTSGDIDSIIRVEIPDLDQVPLYYKTVTNNSRQSKSSAQAQWPML